MEKTAYLRSATVRLEALLARWERLSTALVTVVFFRSQAAASQVEEELKRRYAESRKRGRAA